MKLQATIALLLIAPFLYAQTTDESSNNYKRKSRFYDPQFDRIDYVFKDNLLLSALQHNGGGGYPRTWRYYYEQDQTNKMMNRMKERFPNKQIFGAVEVAFRNTYLLEVVMQDKKRWYVYHVDTLGGVQLKKRFRKL